MATGFEILVIISSSIHMLVFVCLLIVIWTFLISKMLRSHPGLLVLSCCFAELSFYYSCILDYMQMYYDFGYLSFNIFTELTYIINLFSFQSNNLTESDIIRYSLALQEIMITIQCFYYFWLSIDIYL